MPPVTLSPYLTVQNAAETIRFYEQAFGATEVGPRLTTPGGKIMHTELMLGDARYMLADATAQAGRAGRTDAVDNSARMCLEVDDVDAWIQKAVDAGAKLIVPAADQFYGHRSGRITDPGGQQWILTQEIEKLSAEEIQERAANLMGGGEDAST